MALPPPQDPNDANGPQATPKPEATAAARPTSVPRWLKLVLATSLALNIAVVCGVAGLALTFGPPKRPSARLPALAGAYLHALKPAQKRALMRVVRDKFDADRPSPAQVRADFDRLVAVMRAEPFDPGAVRTLLAEQARRFERGREAGVKAMTDILQEMGPEGRAAYADRLEIALERGPAGHPDRKFDPAKDDFKPR